MLTVLPQAPSLLRPDRFPVPRSRRARQGAKAHDRPLGQRSLPTMRSRRRYTARRCANRCWRRCWRNACRPLAKTRSRIDTTIDANIQTTVELLLADRARALPPKVSLAALVIDNRTLDVLAYAGSADFGDDQRFAHCGHGARLALARIDAHKPFLYGLALDEGLIHSESLLADAPQSFSGYQPGNFQQSFHGRESASQKRWSNR